MLDLLEAKQRRICCKRQCLHGNEVMGVNEECEKGEVSGLVRYNAVGRGNISKGNANKRGCPYLQC